MTDRIQRPSRGSHRLAAGGIIDRGQPRTFTFDGKRLAGLEGDTLASALLANGVGVVGRSFKYHRPRGILTAGAEEPNALVELGRGDRREPNTRATMVELYSGLHAASQNRWPSLAFDVLSINRFASPILHAGFYYKTFMWPASFWEKLYEPVIRRAAGLGRAAGAADPDHYEKAFAHCDVLVVGSGPAGLMAALAAGRRGARVILAEEDFTLGGRLLTEATSVGEESSVDWSRRAIAELESLGCVRLMRRTSVFGVYDGGTYGAVERVNDHLPTPAPFEPRQRVWRIFAKRCVLAAGAIERPLVFGGNDRPGIMLAGAARSYLNRFGVTPGRHVAIFTSGDDGWRTARDARRLGIRITAVIDTRAQAAPSLSSELTADLERAGTRIITGGVVVRAHGGKSVHAIDVRMPSQGITRIDCDALLVSGGWSPTLHLTCHLGGKPAWNDAIGAFVPNQLPSGMSVAGAANGVFTLAQCLASGADAGAAAAADTGHSGAVPDVPHAEDELQAVTPMWFVKGSRGAAFVDYQNDVTAKDVGLAAREGYRSVELLKRYTTLGMATDQGKTANVNAVGILAEARQTTIGAVGTTVYRPPYTPVAIGALAGHHRGKDFRPTRLTPAHGWAIAQDAVMREAGMWMRAGWFARGNEDWLAAATREVRATREGVGFCDVSTLGKIDVQGPDAAIFLDRVYCNTFSTLPVGKARYGLMLREDGFVKDDGTTSRLGPEHFLMTTTTANAGGVMQHLEFCLQCLWPDLDVQIASVSEQWAQFSIAGPKSREVLARLVDGQHDISNDAFPYLAAREISVCGGAPARLFRISFSGELAFELAVPARLGEATAAAIAEAGRSFGIVPYGTEALSIMRIEKGHVAGNELNGTTTARDLGLGRMMSTKKDYIGRVLSQRPALVDADRWRLVGLRPVNRTESLSAGSHFIAPDRPASTENDEGYVTSTAFSPWLGHWIGLGLLSRGDSRHRETIRAVDPLRGRDVLVEICDPVFIDPNGERLHV